MESETTRATLIDADQASEMVRIEKATLYLWCRKRRVPYVRLGRALRFEVAALRKWIDEHRVEPE